MKNISDDSFEEMKPSSLVYPHNNGIPRPRTLEIRDFPQENPIARFFNDIARANLVVFALIIIGGIVLSLYTVVAILNVESKPDLGPALSIFLGFWWTSLPFLVIALFLFAVAEIIQILHDIRARLYEDKRGK